MPLLGFRPRFAAPILSGAKRQTIRRPRKDGSPRATEGQTLHLYTGLRTKAAYKLGAAPCLAVDDVAINFRRRVVCITTIAGVRPILAPDDLDEFARADGLEDWADFAATFQDLHGPDLVEFTGVIIRWGDLA